MNARPVEDSQVVSWTDLWVAMRPAQWTKNGLLFAGFIFAGQLRQPLDVKLQGLAAVVQAFVAFCVLSSATYIINDILDVDLDRAHPEKRNRPIPSGRIRISVAWGMSVALILLAAILTVTAATMQRSPGFVAMTLLYFAMTLSYSIWLKHQVIIDVMVLALGFVVRVVAGCVVINVTVSQWLILCTFTLALFMALCKRRHELLAFGDSALSVRKVLPEYTPQMLDVLISLSASASFIFYCLYTTQAPHRDFMGRESPWLLVTVLPVLMGIARYLYLVYRRDGGGKPEDLLGDRVILSTVAVWIIFVLLLSVHARLGL